MLFLCLSDEWSDFSTICCDHTNKSHDFFLLAGIDRPTSPTQAAGGRLSKCCVTGGRSQLYLRLRAAAPLTCCSGSSVRLRCKTRPYTNHRHHVLVPQLCLMFLRNLVASPFTPFNSASMSAVFAVSSQLPSKANSHLHPLLVMFRAISRPRRVSHYLHDLPRRSCQMICCLRTVRPQACLFSFGIATQKATSTSKLSLLFHKKRDQNH